MAYRTELEKYIGQTIPIEADVESRQDSGNPRYGFLLTDISIPEGVTIDHAWLGIYDLDLAQCSGERIRGTATVHEYWQAKRLDGKYEEFGARGIGFADLTEIEVLIDGGWVPLAVVATRFRRAAAARIKEQKQNGTYIWPGSWTCVNGRYLVKAAKSALSGSHCVVSSKNGGDTDVTLTAMIRPGVWEYTKI
jgi:hypothetical protein